jgi:hypothetical protein
MTRINAGFPVKNLTGKHLIAEHREIKRIPNTIKTGKAKIINIPDNFTLGVGHVKFFYNKLNYLKQRYEELFRECILRGYNVTYYGDCFNDLPNELMNDYIVTEEAKNLIEERIFQKLQKL